jgi:hypothetical protein
MQAEQLYDWGRPLSSRAESRLLCPKERVHAPQRRFHPDGSQGMGAGRDLLVCKAPAKPLHKTPEALPRRPVTGLQTEAASPRS